MDDIKMYFDENIELNIAMFTFLVLQLELEISTFLIQGQKKGSLVRSNQIKGNRMHCPLRIKSVF